MLPLRLSAAIVSMAALGFGSGAACGQDYPSKPIRIVTSGAGGGGDFTARQVAQGISGPLGQQVIVENRAGGVLASEFVSKASPDGYTLLVNGASFWIVPLGQVSTIVFTVVFFPSPKWTRRSEADP